MRRLNAIHPAVVFGSVSYCIDYGLCMDDKYIGEGLEIFRQDLCLNMDSGDANGIITQ